MFCTYVMKTTIADAVPLDLRHAIIDRKESKAWPLKPGRSLDSIMDYSAPKSTALAVLKDPGNPPISL